MSLLMRRNSRKLNLQILLYETCGRERRPQGDWHTADKFEISDLRKISLNCLRMKNYKYARKQTHGRANFVSELATLQ